MNYDYLPISHFPTTVVFVDDNKELLIDLTSAIAPSFPYIIFDSTSDALEHITTSTKTSNEKKDKYFSQGEWSIDGILEEIVVDKSRFETLSVVVVDYAMPEMNGLEFCRKIKNTSVKKILLSGKSDETTAILAFNQGIINKYITKHDPLALETLKSDIHFLQKKHHYSFHKPPYKETLPERMQFMQEDRFQEFLNKLCEKNHIVEFHYANADQAYVLLDQSGKTYILKLAKLESDIKKHNDKYKQVNQAHRLPIDQQYYYTFAPLKRKTSSLSSYQDFTTLQNNRHTTLHEFLLCDQHKHKYSVAMHKGDIYLTQREAQCLYYLLKGYTAKQTAKQLSVNVDISYRTIEQYIDQLKKKLAMPSKQDIIASIEIKDLTAE